MLIQLRVENHRSLRDEQALSFAATNLDPQDPRLLRSAALAEPLLPAIALYGANASGKTTVLQALAFMRDAVIFSHRMWDPLAEVPVEPFALSARRMEASLYDVEIVAEGVRYRYGFVASASRIEEEWLFAWPSGHKQTWFEREGGDFSFGRHLTGDNDAIRKLTRANSLFLSGAVQNNHPLLMPLFRWFRAVDVDVRRTRASLTPYTGALVGEAFTATQQLLLPPFEDQRSRERELILELVRAADTGIVDVRVEGTDSRARAAGGSRPRSRLEFRHEAGPSEGETWLPLEVESAGTVAFLEVAPRVVGALSNGGIVCIDELESSLHPMLAAALLRLFQDPKHNTAGAQLLFTTHDTNLLGNALGVSPLRRDQIWFTEKDRTGATHLYPLTDFHPRKQENLERGYLQGRYGAIPFLGGPLGGSETPEET